MYCERLQSLKFVRSSDNCGLSIPFRTQADAGMGVGQMDMIQPPGRSATLRFFDICKIQVSFACILQSPKC